MVLEAGRDLLHPAGTLQGWLLGDHQTASPAGDGFFEAMDIVLVEDTRRLAWPFPDADQDYDTLGRHGCIASLPEKNKFMLLDL